MNVYDRCLDILCDKSRLILNVNGLSNDMAFCNRIDHAMRIAASDISVMYARDRNAAIDTYMEKLNTICINHKNRVN
jgi:hypothetical protein